MPVTLTLSERSSQEWPGKSVAKDGKALFSRTSAMDYLESGRIVESYFQEDDFKDRRIIGCEHGFVQAIYNAYRTSHHLTIRPEDIWFSILSQLNVYFNAHPQALPHFFDRKLRSATPALDLSADDGDVAIYMERALARHITHPDLRAWALPSFSTTTRNDRVVATALMLGDVKRCSLDEKLMECNIPSVTLLGEREDWGALLHKLNMIEIWGGPLKGFVISLRPILRRFVTSFDGNTSEVTYFWKCCLRENHPREYFMLAGWITAFCFWGYDGKRIPHVDSRQEGQIQFDGLVYPPLMVTAIPAAYVSFPVPLIGQRRTTRMLAGLVGFEVLPHSPLLHQRWDRLQPTSGWWIYEETPTFPRLSFS
ncbi:DUF4419 domain-containing protein [Aspergillus ibericus CBS 121593]|uniref:Uncharacterized protein n=1 Tax=Aspergillus ibericus CBS 121593 TaxID=1448316 RepID=A0A395H9C2_9EURO|nr:hypothetical protein BO80DRAFT_377481 [Aspergillus ibericus CBS 121593]RAL02834.1 hypothetical protein BO80DRAFT_377481 [Aspergillus ibericus CBS 121593]